MALRLQTLDISTLHEPLKIVSLGSVFYTSLYITDKYIFKKDLSLKVMRKYPEIEYSIS